MKAITLKLTEDQVELLENISKMAGKTSSEFIKDTIFALLPFSEYSAVKKYLNSFENQNEASTKPNKKYINKLIKNIHDSANARLKRIGVLK